MEKNIEELRRKMMLRVQEVENDFLNSSVLDLSRKLDKLIIKKMEEATN
ncbi:MAG: Spo0E family sporulation regulatory protein-aspartic acid phosphatase [Bacillota bacterium]